MKKKISKKKDINWNEVALLGSAVLNIIQAIKQAEIEKDLHKRNDILNKIAADKNFLESKIKEWQKAYADLKSKTNMLEQDFQQLKNDYSNHVQEIYIIQKELQEKNALIEDLRKENEKLKKAGEK